MKYKCEHCKEQFENSKIKANHIRWKHKINDDYLKQSKERINSYFDLKLGEKKTFSVTCYKCNKIHSVIEREKQFPKKEKYFCSRACANSKNFTEESRLKKSIIAKNSERVKLACKKKTLPKNKCKCCSKLTRNLNFCSRNCKKQNHLQTLNEKEKYYNLAQFRFDLKKYPREFDFTLIQKHGWYKAKNKGDNPNGINRDHLYTISDGFKNNVDPLLLAHPANCKLITHTENLKKRGNSTITLEELLERIRNWDLKFK